MSTVIQSIASEAQLCETAELRERLEKAEAALRAQSLRVKGGTTITAPHFRTMAQAMPQLAWIARPDGFIRWYNQRWFEYTGTTPEQMEGWGWQSVHAPEALAHVMEHWKASIATGEQFEMTFPLRGGDGVFRQFLTRAIPQKDQEGRVLQWFGTNTDVEALTRAEAALRASEIRYRRLFEAAKDGVLILDAQTGQITDANPYILEALGRKLAELVGRELWEIGVFADATASRAAVADSQVRSYVRYDDLPLESKTGLRRDVEVVANVYKENGHRVIQCNIRDITERKAAQRALLESETRMRMATEATGVGIWEWNVLTNAIRWDAQLFRLYGISPTPDGLMRYSDWSGALLPEDLPENERILQDTVRRCGQSRREFRIHRRDNGEVRDIEAVEMVRTNEHGQAEWVLGTNLDTTERKRINASLQQSYTKVEAASRAKDDFLAALSHELRTPLTPVLMTATELEREPALPAEVREQLSLMRRNIELEAQLIDDLLDLTRISHGKLQIAPVVTDIHWLLDHTNEIVRSESLAKQVRTIFKLAAVRHHAMVDPTRFQQVFWNVVKNAIKFTPTGGSVTVSTSNDAGGRILVSVEDTGIGISAEALSHIFNAFDQGDVVDRHRYGGLGLGLAIARAIVEAHHGAIRADSEGVGRGTTFTIALATADAPASSEAANTRTAPGRALRLLLVEDHETTRTVLTRLLTRRGHSVTAAATIREALACFGAARFDAVVSDLGLSDGSGLDLMREIQRQRSVPAIALSGYGMEEDVRQAKEAGFSSLLVKPVKIDQLCQLLDQIKQS